MTDVTPLLSEAIKRQDASAAIPSRSSFPSTNEFLKEAYRINSHIISLRSYLYSIRQAYLSTAIPSRRSQTTGRIPGLTAFQAEKERRYLNDSQRDQIDAESKQVLRELNAAIRNLSDAEQLRQNTETTISRQKHGRGGLGALGKWAAGGLVQGKSAEEEADDAKANGIRLHRDGILWYLKRRLEECGEVQRSMMETRLIREVEKSKSVLYKTQGSRISASLLEAESSNKSSSVNGRSANTALKGAQLDEQERKHIEQQLSPEQLQLFAQENQDMLKHYEGALDQVRTAEQSLIEISEMQTTLANNLAVQSAHIDQLVADSFQTTENIGGGNKELKKATERKSTAKYVFYASCGLSLFLVAWDLVI